MWNSHLYASTIKSANLQPKRRSIPTKKQPTINAPEVRESSMKELLTAIMEIWRAFFRIFIVGLINFDSPILSLMDYFLWISVIFRAAKKILKK